MVNYGVLDAAGERSLNKAYAIIRKKKKCIDCGLYGCICQTNLQEFKVVEDE